MLGDAFLLLPNETDAGCRWIYGVFLFLFFYQTILATSLLGKRYHAGGVGIRESGVGREGEVSCTLVISVILLVFILLADFPVFIRVYMHVCWLVGFLSWVAEHIGMVFFLRVCWIGRVRGNIE